ncbi:glycoside hydrolase family 88 protein [Ruminiclostridium cellobioparum]|uniref:Glycosyl hydrolase family 88 protein n=1 Tax=Ruminiclostridium cellobioparum subsp. termitidis CT1112 TaxID=1195236 RepID=S0FPY2_RUMCE|nr:glycoside hydrolase family 88 protein [Ruminiclostridium cellobioparum]EMS72391.1 glycosyl hydrolase family 88 protein [Ruminiclostridium cellobioparum subsp. termitidis CT1112]
MENDSVIRKVKQALLSMQRYSWEQGVAAQAFLEMGEKELVIQMSKAAVLNQLADGRLAAIGNISAVTDPAGIGEAVLYASEVTKDPELGSAVQKLLNWLLEKAPRNRDGIIYHVIEKPQMWVDSFYMSPPFLSAAGYHQEALKQIKGYISLLYNPEKKLFSHIWDESKNDFARKDFWGVGNGWALAGITRVIATLPEEFNAEKNELINFVKTVLDSCLGHMRTDGLFHDVLDNKDSFIETNLAQMAAYTIYRGMKAGWLGDVYLTFAETMRNAAHAKVDDLGFVQGVCGAPFFDRPGIAAEGQSFFLLMEAAAQEFYKSR